MDINFKIARKENNLIHRQCIGKIKGYFKSSPKIYELGLELKYELEDESDESDEFDELDLCLASVLYLGQLNLSATKTRRQLLNACKILNKEESEYLYNYIEETEEFYCFIWRDDFMNYLLVESSELTKIENELIIEEMIL